MATSTAGETIVNVRSVVGGGGFSYTPPSGTYALLTVIAAAANLGGPQATLQGAPVGVGTFLVPPGAILDVPIGGSFVGSAREFALP